MGTAVIAARMHRGRRLRRIIIAAALAPLLAGAVAAHSDDRPLHKVGGPTAVYPINGGFAVNAANKFGEVTLYVRYDVYYAEGSKSAEYMCRNKPNRIRVNHRARHNWEKEHKKFAEGEMVNGRLYTVMFDRHQQQRTGTDTHNNNCLYYMTKLRPNAHGKVNLIVKNLDSGFVKARHSLGNGWIKLQWQRPKGNVTGYSIYHAEGTIDGGNTAHKMCGEEPNRANARAGATAHTVTGLAPGGTYTFLVEAHFNSRDDGVNCAIVYHVGATLRAAQAAVPRNINPQSKDVSHIAGDETVRIQWKRPRGQVAGYSIYHALGTVNAETLCGARPNAIDINDRNAQRRDITGLKNGETYTFLLKVNGTSGEFGPCPYLYRFTTKVDKPRITEIIHLQPGRAKLEQRDWFKIWIEYPRVRGAIDYHLYWKRGKHTDPKKFCAERPNARSTEGWTGFELDHFQRWTEYTFMIEPQFGDRPPMRLRTVCHSVLFGHQTATQWAR